MVLKGSFTDCENLGHFPLQVCFQIGGVRPGAVLENTGDYTSERSARSNLSSARHSALPPSDQTFRPPNPRASMLPALLSTLFSNTPEEESVIEKPKCWVHLSLSWGGLGQAVLIIYDLAGRCWTPWFHFYLQHLRPASFRVAVSTAGRAGTGCGGCAALPPALAGHQEHWGRRESDLQIPQCCHYQAQGEQDEQGAGPGAEPQIKVTRHTESKPSVDSAGAYSASY